MTRWMRAAALALLVPALAACDDDGTEPNDHADDVAIIRLAVGTQTFNIMQSGAQGGLTIPVGSTPVTATFLAANNDVLTIGSNFRLDVDSQNSSRVTFTRTGSFSGTLTGVAAGTAVVNVCLRHIADNHCDFGPHPINVTVQ